MIDFGGGCCSVNDGCNDNVFMATYLSPVSSVCSYFIIAVRGIFESMDRSNFLVVSHSNFLAVCSLCLLAIVDKDFITAASLSMPYGMNRPCNQNGGSS